MLDGYVDETLKARISALPGVLRADSLESLERLLAEDKLPYRLNGRGARNLLVNHRKVDGGFNFFIYNDDCAHSAPATLELDGELCAYSCNGIDGSIESLAVKHSDGRIQIKLDVPCGAGIMLAPEADTPLIAALEAPATLIKLDENYTILPEDDNTLLLEY